MIDSSKVPVFIVDDDQAIVGMVRQTLKLQGFTNVVVAESGKEALEKIKLPPLGSDGSTAQMPQTNIFILDIMLPDINGLDLCSQIKDAYPETIVILISGFDIENLHKRLLEVDADDFLTKPFNPMELAARIKLQIHKYNKYNIKASLFHGAGPETYSNQVPHVGDTIEDYHIIDCLGWGKSSIIYKVIERRGSRVFALKLLTRYALDFEEVVRRFRNEVKLMSNIRNRNVIRYYKMSEYQGCPYILMDYINGINLEEFIVTKGLPNLRTVLTVALKTAGALEAVHREHILHRDVKLKNIMICTDSGIVKLTDFGIAKLLDESLDITHEGFILGTPIYMAPEVLRGEAATPESDMYSYGVTLYQFITGSPPFIAPNNAELYKMHLEKQPVPILSSRRDIPPALEDLIIKKCMAKDPERRPASMSEIINELDRIVKENTVSLSCQ